MSERIGITKIQNAVQKAVEDKLREAVAAKVPRGGTVIIVPRVVVTGKAIKSNSLR